MAGQEGLYLIAIVPPRDLEIAIEKIRQEFAANFHCYRALKPPVHLTLVDPFRIPVDLMKSSLESLSSLLSTRPSFELELKGFGFFENPRAPVLFIHALKNDPLLQVYAELRKLAKQLLHLEHPGNTFNPHFTIGYRDTNPKMLPDMKRAYGTRPFNAAFTADKVRLFKHDGIKWEISHDFPLA